MPRLWTATIDAHRREVRDAVLDTTARLVAEHGLLSVTMSRIAEETGIGRATLYKYFSDVEAILLAWHARAIDDHLRQLAEVREQAGDSGQRLEAMLTTYALICHESRGNHDTELAAVMHRGARVAKAELQLRHLVREVLAEAADDGVIRGDMAVDDLVTYCLHALTAGRTMRSRAAVHRLVSVTLDGLRLPR